MTVEAFAPAKINLTLHVTGQRADGYHLLDSLVVFADIGDRITVAAADERSLQVTGPMAVGVPVDDSNLMMQAAALMDPARGAALSLEKNLPPASGIGGGSSDAAATLRALSGLWGLPLPGTQDVLPLGADVPVCMSPSTQRMRGIGERLDGLPPLPDCAIVLINPGVSVATPAIFRAMGKRDNPAMPAELPTWDSVGDLAAWLKTQRNDLQPPAIRLEPVIGTVLEELSGTDPLYHAMSGSGATCYGLYSTDAEAEAAADQLRAAHADWWVRAGRLLA
ncbi:putative 4-diphosphocytidyl-2-C-methyl-D-erythritol kinase [Phaeobacter inhibens]|uniref:4-diphosphocytidyl-2-C-methyl-D-erythritol kinase n=1 Tax=Phaeobacter inhibens TaxID=221822 RepID=A0A2I7K5G3_9RHOB|nr:4-(cytidine 5'-diphospho)-2-C-methyl-D-erythritol kinase [Phaeobacter inhibens]AUQ51279.1 putative 4-diphosphocytidyl-2-C-methyl-D-erythritol kinase [Phaeobacter inhibens]AUQ95798.1 putative 4-diphosphocytidyl-2-C-methyl-D-erythritol kinase [Phaeobacter inhibens]AUQ97730.1 putative 4-diphosphocytidyl-2-C-methyl-D-erythritol kinase [Phaeobacter inhibens]AUR21084.1 putative 4-diphosphocytidyl-2-C-methyl-D-erythritol kinase [Phaeobacter inhibens]